MACTSPPLRLERDRSLALLAPSVRLARQRLVADASLDAIGSARSAARLVAGVSSRDSASATKILDPERVDLDADAAGGSGRGGQGVRRACGGRRPGAASGRRPGRARRRRPGRPNASTKPASSGPGARHDRQGRGRREAERPAPPGHARPRRGGRGRRSRRGLEHLVVGQAGLHQQPAAAAAGPDAAGRRGPGGRAPARRPGSGAPAARRRSRGRRRRRPTAPGAARPRCRRTPRRPPRALARRVAAVTSTHGAPAAASSSSRRRPTPGRRHDRRARAARPGTRPGAPCRTGRSAGAPLVGLAHGGVAHGSARSAGSARHARRPAAGPARGVEHADHRAAGVAAGASSGAREQRPSSTGPRRGGRRPRRSASPPAPRRATASSTRRRPAERLERRRPATTSTHGTPARRARSMATSRACHVGRPLLLERLVVLVEHDDRGRGRATGAHAAARAPTTTSRPPAAAAQSSRHDGHGAARRGAAGRPAAGPGRPTGITTRAVARATAAARTTPRRIGGRRQPQHGAPSLRRRARPGGRAGIDRHQDRPAVTARAGRRGAPPAGGEAAARKAPDRSAAHRQARPRRQVDEVGRRARSPVTLAIGRSLAPGTPGSGVARARPPSRRPAGRAGGTRTIVPTRDLARASSSGTR